MTDHQQQRPPCQGATPTHLFTEPLGKTSQLNGNDYYTGEQVTTALNRLLGADGWSWKVLEHGKDEESDEVWVLGELQAVIWEHDPNDEGFVRHVVVKQQFGAQSIKRRRPVKNQQGEVIGGGEALSIGDDRKGAATDALKKAASLLGIGLHLWAKELPYRRPADEAPQRPAAGTQKAPQPRNQPAAAEIPLADRETLLARYGDLLEHATAMGFKAGWVGQDTGKLSEVQLSKYSEIAGAFIGRNQEGAA